MGGQLFKWFGSLTYWGFLRLQTFNCLLKINFLLKKINCRHLNEEILANEISSFKFPRKVFLKRKLTIRFWLPKIVFLLDILLKKWFQFHIILKHWTCTICNGMLNPRWFLIWWLKIEHVAIFLSALKRIWPRGILEPCETSTQSTKRHL